VKPPQFRVYFAVGSAMSGSNEIWSHKHIDPQFNTSRQTLDAAALGLKGFKKAKLQREKVIISGPIFGWIRV